MPIPKIEKQDITKALNYEDVLVSVSETTEREKMIQHPIEYRNPFFFSADRIKKFNISWGPWYR